MTENRLSALDSSFLHLERAGTHMHVVSALVLQGTTPAYRDFADHVEARLHKVPRFRQKLRAIPYGQGRPVWVDDPQFNLSYHVRHTALPAPGGIDELRTLAARILSQGIDPSKPLWELWLVDRLEGDRFAVIGKSHNSLVDGVSAVDITTMIFDTAPDAGPTPTAPPWVPEPEPSDAELLGAALAERATRPGEALRSARAVLRTPRAAVGSTAKLASGLVERVGLGGAAPDSPINSTEIGPYRRCWWTDLELERLKRVKNYLGGSVNDIVLGTVAGGIHHYLRDGGHATTGLELKALVPLSVKRSGELSNSLSSVLVPLPIWCEDPRQRVRIISDATADLKKRDGAVAADMLAELSDFLPPTITSQAARMQARQSLFNIVVTNVPGPQFPLYLLGRRLEATYPLLPLASEQVVCAGAMSYCGRIHMCLVGDFDLIGDLDRLGSCVERALDEMVALIPKKEGRMAGARRRRSNGTPESERQTDPDTEPGPPSGSDPGTGADPGPEPATIP